MTGLNDTDIRLNSEWQLTQATDGDAPLCSGLECLYQGQLNELPQRQKMDLGQEETVVSVYLGLMLGFAKDRVRRFF